MPRFFIDPQQPGVQTVLLNGEDGRHAARVLRVRVGEALTLSDGAGTDYDGEVEAVSGDSVVVRICGTHANESEPRLAVTLYQGLPKADKLDFIVQKATELGAVRIVPVLMARCVSRPEKKAAEKRLERLSRIALEAAKQSGRGRVPEIGAVQSFSEAVKNAAGEKIFFYEGGGAAISSLISKKTQAVSIFIGPEGGFSEEEVALALESGVASATLGPRILRTETAPLAALSVLLFLSGDMA